MEKNKQYSYLRCLSFMYSSWFLSAWANAKVDRLAGKYWSFLFLGISWYFDTHGQWNYNIWSDASVMEKS